MTTKITEQNISNLANAGVNWQSVFTGDGSTGLTAVAGRGYFIDTTSGTVTVTLPNDASSSIGDTIIIRDYAGTFATNNVTITSTAKISEADADGTLSTNDLVMTLTYVNSTKGWVTIENEAKSFAAADTLFISATGGTITTSGDFKIHTFTGDGCFVVSQAPVGSAPGVDYLVVAGGAGGGGDGAGGGGAGGFRVSNSLSLPAPTTSPLASSCGLTVTATTYPVTVGGGGTAGVYSPASDGGQGSNSVFSTITSAGGGYGARGAPSCAPINTGAAGGSGGGGTRAGTGGSGNTPPVSPPQGNPGGPGGPTPNGDGGGGAGTAGGNSTSNPTAGTGGEGSYVSPSLAVGCQGTSGPVCGVRYFSGGGGGGGDQSVSSGGAGGSGGGGTGGSRPNPAPGTAGSANTGGGGGGAGVPGNAGTGGKGIVIIRYKFQ